MFVRTIGDVLDIHLDPLEAKRFRGRLAFVVRQKAVREVKGPSKPDTLSQPVLPGFGLLLEHLFIASPEKSVDVLRSDGKCRRLDMKIGPELSRQQGNKPGIRSHLGNGDHWWIRMDVLSDNDVAKLD